MLLICLSFAWIAGTFVGSRLSLPLALSLTGLVPLFLPFLFRKHKKFLFTSSLALFAFFIASVYANSSLYAFDDNNLRFYDDRGAVELRGMVSEDPDVRDKSTRLKYSVSEIRVEDAWRKVEGAALAIVPRFPEYHYGDLLRVTGELETPPQLDDFDYRGYLSHQGIYSTLLYPQIEVLDTGGGFRPLAWIYTLRSRLAQVLGRALPEPQASLAQGIVLGLRASIPATLNEDFARSGTTHLLAISGVNLSIMAGILLSAGLWLFGRRHYVYVWLAMGVIWLYALITGMNPPVVRGAIMASLFLAAEFLGRQRSAMVALALAAAVMVGVSPYLLGDAAFQLSFLAMAGLIFITPYFQNNGRKVVAAKLGESGAASLANLAVDALSATLGAIIAVWPVVAYHFGIISLVGPLATFLALPALTGIIVLGSLTAILGLIALPLAQVAGCVAWLFLSYLMLVVSGMAAPSMSSIETGPVSITFVVIYYAALAAAVWLSRSRERWLNLYAGAATRIRSGFNAFDSSRIGKWVVFPLLVIAVLVSCTAATMPDDNLHVAFLDVGEGDAVLIQRGSQQLLIDGGPSPQAIDLALGKQMPFWDRTIDLLVLTHPHQDHLAGLVEVAGRYRVGQVLYTELDYNSPLYEEWLRLIEEKGIQSTNALAGQQVDLGNGTVIEVLNPQTEALSGTESDVDNNSVVLRLSHGNISFLLAADIMREAEWGLVGNRADLHSTMLKVAHHGSDTSSTPEFLAVVSPQIAIISAGAGNRFGHPSNEVLDRLEERIGSENIYRTDISGTVEFVTDGEKLWVRKDR